LTAAATSYNAVHEWLLVVGEWLVVVGEWVLVVGDAEKVRHETAQQ